MLDELDRLGRAFIDWLPNLIGAIVIFIIGWIIALLLKSATKRILSELKLNERVAKSPADDFVGRVTTNPTLAIAGAVYWLIMIITITIVIGALEIPVLTSLVAGIYGYVPNILAAILILVIALALSAFISGIIAKWMGDTATGKIVSAIVPILILSISGFAILEQLKIAPVIITVTYIALIGSIALASAIAFGLGGRDVAARLLESGYEKGIRGYSQARRDIETGRRRAEEDVDRAKDRFRGRSK